MANSGVIFREIRFLIEDELTQVYVRCDVTGDSPLGIQGWHHKTFPASIAIIDLIPGIFLNGDDPIMWPQAAPPS